FAQDDSLEYVVRLYYVVPSDQEPTPDIDVTLNEMIKKAQLAFAELMENHEFDRKTFAYETDADGNAVVHHVVGAANAASFYDKYAAALEAIYGRYTPIVDDMEAIIDEHPPFINIIIFDYDEGPNLCGEAGRNSRIAFVKLGGGCLNHHVMAHELAHVFGLWHYNIVDDVLIPNSYTHESMLRSFRSAEWLNISRYFNTDLKNSTGPTTTHMLPPLASPPNAVRLRFEVADPDGLYIAQLVVAAPGGGDVIASKRLQGNKAIVEFETTKLGLILDGGIVTILVVDETGDIADFHSNSYPIDITPVLPPPEIISIPDQNLAAIVRKTLGLTENSDITQLDMLKLTTLKNSEKPEKRNIPEHQITDLTGIKHALNLKYLYLWNNQIRDITSIVALKQLEVVDLRNNQISSLYLQGNPIENRKPLLELLEKNPDVKIYLKWGGEPLPVTLSHFRAEHTNAGVILKWTTESEVDNAGFFIYRSETKDGEFKVVNPTMIQGAGTTGERNEYTWTDTTAKPNTVYYYRIEDVSHAGMRKQLATVRLRGLVSASGKLTTRWAGLRKQN
ncbi:leucine-rich repeat domain-containing protein, partial [Candidatus Poribacteria bacterium]|nr:leucine-rich repeat domain-containing protein [Candidatus Poribacteria bacterium]